eukprot:gb/GECH01011327.1/.p1 GENE.gb/GECH01011327.1/~~gb/GECH01011327.1/.p1  ORF type:complete len:398 (+),score=74.98 gb/GECH01011327.1/:1-1194(+)
MKVLSVIVFLLGLSSLALASQPEASASNVECSLCEFVIGEAERFITNTSNEKNIERVLDHICDVLPKQSESFCKSLVNQYTPELINYIKSQYPADVICKKIGLCDSSVQVEVVSPAKEETFQASESGCAICNYLVNLAENYLEEHKTEKELEDILDRACTFLPDQYQAACESAVTIYGPSIIKKIINKDISELDKVCDAIGVCDKDTQNQEQQNEESPQSSANLECAVCEYLLSYLENMVDSSTTIDEIDKVCDILPSSVSKSCHEIVETYGPQILDYLVNKYPADKVCGMISLCKSAQDEVKKPQSADDFYCTTCEFVMKYLDGYLSKDTTIQDMLNFLNHDVCDKLPSELGSVCHLFVDMEADKVIRAIIKDISPDRVCSFIDACDRASIVHIKE